MDTQTFLTELQETLELESFLTFETEFKELGEWDSLTAMVLMSYVKDNFNIKLNAEDLDQLTTISTLIDRIGREKFDGN